MNEEIRKEAEAIVKIIFELAEFNGRKAIAILTGVLCSIISAIANDGKQDEIVEVVIDELKSGVKLMKNTNPIAGKITAIISHLKNSQKHNLN